MTAAAPGGPETGDLRRQVVVVTGGWRGVGRAMARCFARAGATVLAAARTASELTETVEQVGRDGSIAHARPGGRRRGRRRIGRRRRVPAAPLSCRLPR
jgi:NAD(P)-dependent dehydrogenase (short-subunit alcohol dehydrogenase family)